MAERQYKAFSELGALWVQISDSSDSSFSEIFQVDAKRTTEERRQHAPKEGHAAPS